MTSWNSEPPGYYDISDQRAEAMYDKIYEILEKYGFGGTLDAGLAKDLYRLVGDAYGEGYAEGSSVARMGEGQ